MPRDYRSLSPRALVLAVLCLSSGLALACSSRPASPTVTGEQWQHPQAEFGLVLPDGWQSSISSTGVSLVRALPYGGGYPTLNVRRIGDDEANVLSFKGDSFETTQAQLEYRYQRWHNPRGSGYRLEVLVTLQGLQLFVEASIWDPARALNKDFFEEAFWPIINSIHSQDGSSI